MWGEGVSFCWCVCGGGSSGVTYWVVKEHVVHTIRTCGHHHPSARLGQEKFIITHWLCVCVCGGGVMHLKVLSPLAYEVGCYRCVETLHLAR